MSYVGVLVTALIFSMLLTRAHMALAHRRGWLDQPSPRRVHSKPTPRVGGMAMFLCFALVSIGLMLFEQVRGYTGLGLLAGAAALTLVGLVDDVWGLGAGTKFRFQVLAALVTVVAFDVAIKTVTLPVLGSVHLEGSLAGYGLTLFFVLGMINTVNFVDGIDGLAAGLAVVFSLVLFVISLRVGQPELPLYATALAGTTLGFLRYNFAPARIFMGDSGSMFLGFTMGALSVLGNAKIALALLVMGLPVVDVAYSIWRRHRTGAPVHLPDKAHLHHRFLAMGLSQRRTATLFYLLAFGFGSAALLPQREGRIVALVLLGAFSLATIWWVNRRLTVLSRLVTKDG